MSVLVVGSIGLDTVKTPLEEKADLVKKDTRKGEIDMKVY